MSKIKVGLDIGHGENTWEAGGGKGVVRNGKVYEEHHFNAAVAIIAEQRLVEHGFEVFMAQKPYQNDVPLRTRTNQYNSRGMDLVISIHANAGASSANGAGAFYWHTARGSKRLAEIFMKHWLSTVDGVGQYNIGAIPSVPNTWTNFHMVRETKMDAILIECGFMTNANDFEYIFGKYKDTYIPQVAETIVKTVCEYKGVKYRPKGKNAPETKPVVPAPVQNGYKVKAGDTMYSIAREHKIALDVLMKANPNVNPHAMQVGTYLTIPTSNTAPVPKGDMNTTSIVEYLKSIGEDSSFANRKRLAEQYGISGYTGTAGQNLQLLDLLRRGTKPASSKPKGDQNTNSLVDYLKSIGVDSGFANRKKLAEQHGIKNYKGTASQNTALLKKIRGH